MLPFFSRSYLKIAIDFARSKIAFGNERATMKSRREGNRSPGGGHEIRFDAYFLVHFAHALNVAVPSVPKEMVV